MAEDPLVKRLIKITESCIRFQSRTQVYLNDLRARATGKSETERYAFSYLIEETDSGVHISEEIKDSRDARKLLSDCGKEWGN